MIIFFIAKIRQSFLSDISLIIEGTFLTEQQIRCFLKTTQKHNLDSFIKSISSGNLLRQILVKFRSVGKWKHTTIHTKTTSKGSKGIIKISSKINKH
jgi:hypothetical protein